MASYQNVDSTAIRKTTPSTKLGPGNDDGATPRATSVKRANIPKPLQTNNFSNLQTGRSISKDMQTVPDMENVLKKLQLNEPCKVSPREVKHTTTGNFGRHEPPDSATDSDFSSARDLDRVSSSELYTPATDVFGTSETDRLKKELDAAKNMINQQQRELEESRNFKHTIDQALPSPSEPDFARIDTRMASMQSAFNASARPFNASQWPRDTPISTSAAAHNADGRSNAGNKTTQFASTEGFGQGREPRNGTSSTDFSDIYGHSVSTYDVRSSAAERTFSNSLAAPLSPSLPPTPYSDMFSSGPPSARSFQYRSAYSPVSPQGFGAASVEPLSQFAAINPDLMQQIQLNQALINATRNGAGVLTPSPTTDTFATASLGMSGAPYGSQAANATFVGSMEPMNYRRLLDKSVSCDWRYVVDKIVCNNDQQASIFLQQKLKVGTAEQKYEIVEAIINQAYPLMINRFGNFLVQRCFEHSTPDQVVAIADAIHGNVISLSMDPFGCHVVQKAFDSVPEEHKADMVRELLRRIPDTVIHRYACHVWQKLFELRWSNDKKPQIMDKVNDALQGMWHEVALGETGSLVVQNIFENCVEEEKRPAIEEVISNIDLIAHGQFGNWCIQHLCEHSAPPDKRRVVDHILHNAYSYSIDQYASKVVEKCLKIGGIEFLERYLGVITTSHHDRPRIPLIDIAGDQYGNYLIQWILMNTHQQQREQVAMHIRKHMVSLRGSKFGSRVAMLCCNPASATRPGPGAMVNPYGAPSQPRGQYSRYR